MEKKPTEILEDEHRVIEKVAKAMGLLAEGMERGREVQPDILREVTGFMREYGDGFHHGKEEKVLFPFLVERGVPANGCPIAALSQEHETGRLLVRDLSQAIDGYGRGDAVARETVVKDLKRLALLYENHIWKEDYLLFPMTNKVLNASDQEELYRRFGQADASVGQDALSRCRGLADELEKYMQPA